VSELHTEHVRAHFARVGGGVVTVTDPRAIFLGAEDGDSFQELVALGMTGARGVMLAVLRFPKHGLSGVPYSRESLARYLTSPPHTGRSGQLPVPSGQIAALLPRTNEAIPGFLAGLRAGRATPSVILDPSRIRLAFDFRGHNPSASPIAKGAAGPLRAVAIRTVDGHVLTGRASRIGGEGDRDRFVAVADVVQVTPRGTVQISDLILNTSWIAICADVTEETPRIATAFWAPFLAKDASPEIVVGLPAAAPARERAQPTPVPAALPEGRFPGLLAR
jgi:hypothetical protein